MGNKYQRSFDGSLRNFAGIDTHPVLNREKYAARTKGWSALTSARLAEMQQQTIALGQCAPPRDDPGSNQKVGRVDSTRLASTPLQTSAQGSERSTSDNDSGDEIIEVEPALHIPRVTAR